MSTTGTLSRDGKTRLKGKAATTKMRVPVKGDQVAELAPSLTQIYSKCYALALYVPQTWKRVT